MASGEGSRLGENRWKANTRSKLCENRSRSGLTWATHRPARALQTTKHRARQSTIKGLPVRELQAGKFKVQFLDPQRATERPGAIVRLRTIVIHKDLAEAAITKESAAEFSNSSRCSHPARRLRIEISKFLQLSILFFRQKLNAHGRCHIDSVIFRFVFSPGFLAFAVVTHTSAAARTFC